MTATQRRRRWVRRRVVTLTARTLVFLGLAVLVWQRIIYVTMDFPGAWATLTGTVLFAVGMMAVVAQLENALDRADRERDLAEYDRRAEAIRESREGVEGGR